ncbi:MAG: class I SAM-dependent methyltransferase [Chloroflexota bacterium]
MALPVPKALVEGLTFLWGFLRHPRTVGSVVPSSRFLAAAVAGHVPPGVRCVAEIGPGTGPITRALLDRLGPDAILLALEIDPAFCAVLRSNLPDPRLRVVQAAAEDLPAYAARLPRPIEAVVSGLPFANFPAPLRHAIMRAAYDSLAPGGVFAGYSYAPVVLPLLLRAYLGHCRTSIVLRNLPPAFVFSARKSRGKDGHGGGGLRPDRPPPAP